MSSEGSPMDYHGLLNTGGASANASSTYRLQAHANIPDPDPTDNSSDLLENLTHGASPEILPENTEDQGLSLRSKFLEVKNELEKLHQSTNLDDKEKISCLNSILQIIQKAEKDGNLNKIAKRIIKEKHPNLPQSVEEIKRDLLEILYQLENTAPVEGGNDLQSRSCTGPRTHDGHPLLETSDESTTTLQSFPFPMSTEAEGSTSLPSFGNTFWFEGGHLTTFLLDNDDTFPTESDGSTGNLPCNSPSTSMEIGESTCSLPCNMPSTSSGILQSPTTVNNNIATKKQKVSTKIEISVLKELIEDLKKRNNMLKEELTTLEKVFRQVFLSLLETNGNHE